MTNSDKACTLCGNHRPAACPLLGTPGYKLNTERSVAVATEVFWNKDMSTCPRGVKVQLLGSGGVGVYSNYGGDPFWIGWAPLPRNRPA